MKKQIIQPPIFILLVLFVVAFFFRFYQLAQIPPGLLPDEATHALDALEVLEGQFTLYSPDEGSTGSLWRYLLALHFALFGSSILSLRIFASVVGVLSVLMAYLVVRELALTPATQTPPPPQKKRLSSFSPGATGWSEVIALVAALLLAVSYWHVALSRIGFSAVLMLLIQDATLFCLWRAVASGRQRWFLLFGLGLGLLVYNYLPGKLVPVMVLLFLLLNWVIARPQSLLAKQGRSLLTAGSLALVIALPLLVFALFNYQMLVARATVPTTGAVASVSPLRGLVANLAAFGLWPTLWLSGQWDTFFLGPVLTLCFVVGVGLSLTRIRRPEYLFLLVWWFVLLLPAALAPEGAIPHTRRAIGTATVTFALASLGLASLVVLFFRLAQRLSARRWTGLNLKYGLIPILLTVVLGLWLAGRNGLNTFQRYFVIWGPSEEAELDFHVYDLALADLMARESGMETVYLLPLDSTAGIVNPLLDTITFVYDGDAAYDFLPDDEQRMLERLAELTAGKEIVRLLRWKVTKHTGADPKHVAPYYLEKWGDWVDTASYPYFEIDTYEISNPASDLVSPATLTPAEVDFEGQMRLTGYAFGAEHLQAELPSVGDDRLAQSAGSDRWPAGQLGWVELAWQKTGELPLDYQTGVWLEDQAGHVVGRVDSPLISNRAHQVSSQWPVGSQERTYHLLRVDPATPPGRYQLKAVLYTAAGQEQAGSRRLAPQLPGVAADLAVPLGQVEVGPPLFPPDPTALSIPQPLNLELGQGLQLLGFDPGFEDALRPGDQATLSLWWQAENSLSRDLAVAVGMGNDQQAWSLSEPQPVGGRDYPTSEWASETVVRTFVDIRLPADVDTGRYNLGVRLLDTQTRDSLADWLLGQVEVAGRSRDFELPDLDHPIGANFGDQITLLGYDLDLTGAEATGSVRLGLYWQAQTEMTTSYKVFVHLLNEAGQIVSQIDREPQAGQAPTTSWLPDEVVKDVFDLPADQQLETVSGFAIGLYNPKDGKRLPVVGETSTLEADTTVTIELR